MGPAIDVLFNLDGGRYRTHRQRPPGGPPSMSYSTSVVAATGPTGSAPLGVPPSTSSSTSVVATTGPVGSAPQGARHRRLLQPWWWWLPDPPTAPPGGPPSTSFSNSMVDVARPTDSTSRGPAINVLQLSGSSSHTSGRASQGAIMSRTFLSKINSGSLYF
jgi:hypothetical protein